EQPADLRPLAAFDRLQDQTNLPDGGAGRLLDSQPQTMSVDRVALELAVQPLVGRFAAESAVVMVADLRVGHHRCQEVEIVGFELAQDETFGFENDGSSHDRVAFTPQRVTQGLNCSSFWRRALMASASPFLSYLPTRTPYRRRLPEPRGVTNAGYPFALSRCASASASARVVTACTCTAHPLPGGSG